MILDNICYKFCFNMIYCLLFTVFKVNENIVKIYMKVTLEASKRNLNYIQRSKY